MALQLLRRLSAFLATGIASFQFPPQLRRRSREDKICSSKSKSDSGDLTVQFPLFLFIGNSLFAASLFHGRTQSSINPGNP